MRARSGLLAIVVTCTLFAGVSAEEQAPPRPPTPYGLLYKEWKSEVTDVDKAAPPLASSEKRERHREINARFAPRFVDLANRHWREEAVQCMIWMSAESPSGPACDELFSLLETRAADLDSQGCFQLQLQMSQLIKLNSDRLNPALEAIVKTHSDEKLKGAALFALAARVKQDGEQEGSLEKCRSAEKMLERVLSEFPSVHTYLGENRETATALLDELHGPATIGKLVPEARGVTFDGQEVRLSDAIRGKVAVISFSGHWCRPCVAMHPVQKELLSKYPRDRVVVVEINSDPKESAEKVRARIAADGLSWLIVADGSGHPIADEWKVSAWPTYVVVDKDGKIRRRVTGNLGRLLIEWVDELVPVTKD